MRNSYSEIGELSCYYLEDSWILDIVARPQSLSLEMDIVLTPEHSEYADPGPEDQYCYRRGTLRFLGVRDLSWRGQGAPPALDASNVPDYGSIDTLEISGEAYYMEGDFGVISVVAAHLEVVLDGA